MCPKGRNFCGQCSFPLRPYQFWSATGCWTSIHGQGSRALVQARSRRKHQVKLTIGEGDYYIDLNEMSRTNTQTGEVHPMRQLEPLVDGNRITEKSPSQQINFTQLVVGLADRRKSREANSAAEEVVAPPPPPPPPPRPRKGIQNDQPGHFSDLPSHFSLRIHNNNGQALDLAAVQKHFTAPSVRTETSSKPTTKQIFQGMENNDQQQHIQSPIERQTIPLSPRMELYRSSDRTSNSSGDGYDTDEDAGDIRIPYDIERSDSNSLSFAETLPRERIVRAKIASYEKPSESSSPKPTSRPPNIFFIGSSCYINQSAACAQDDQSTVEWNVKAPEGSAACARNDDQSTVE